MACRAGCDKASASLTRRHPAAQILRVHLAGIVTRALSAAHHALNVVLPPQCLACSVPVETSGSMCGDCWREIDFIAPPLCVTCGLPFEYDHGASALCGACTRERPPFGHARAAMRYGDVSARLIIGFKHGDRTHGAPAFARLMARAGSDLLPQTDLIVPVPLHRWRLAARKYNQAAMLAQALARLCDVPAAVDHLVRIRRTSSQGRMSASARRRNVRGAFAVRADATSRIEGRRLLLVDDVYTTGATVTECSRALLEAGAEAVDVLTLARTVAPAALR
ncbi:MAG: ComF family protein [Alphaproteobacteria bacterium]